MQLFTYKGWRILSFIPYEDAENLFNKVQSGEQESIHWLKRHHRSDVFIFKYQGHLLVLKIPKEKNSRSWIRFTTLYRSGEAFKNIQSMQLLEKLGIPTTKPIMAAEKRKFGMVVDSWLVYEYLQGETCLDNKAQYPAVVKLLSEIHDKGYLHGDPQVRNFIIGNKGLSIIDSNPSRPFFRGFSKAYEFAYLAKSTDGIEPYFGNIKNSLLYKFSKWYDRRDRQLAALRRKIRGGLNFKK